MSSRDADLDDEGMGSGENLEPDPEREARRDQFERAARAGADELAGVVEQNISELANEFEARTERVVKGMLEGIDGGEKPNGFVRGAVFGAIVFAVGVLLGRRN